MRDSTKFYNDLNELISDNIADAYIIATPNFTHFNILERILKTNKHLLIEKPLCTTSEDCKKFELISKNYSKIVLQIMTYFEKPDLKEDENLKEILKLTIDNIFQKAVMQPIYCPYYVKFIKTLDDKPFLYGKEDYRNPSLLIKRSKNLND